MISGETVGDEARGHGAATEFEAFVARVEPALRRAHIAAYGPERGREATAEALAWAWEHWERARVMDRPAAYLYKVGRSRTRRRRTPAVTPPEPAPPPPLDDPTLRNALAELSERQRVCVVLVHGFAYTAVEVADILGIRPTSVQNHLERGLAHLRNLLEDQ